MPSTDAREYQRISLDQLEVSAFNVRKREITGDIDELARSLEELGLQQPIVVQPRGDRFEIVIGQRRYLAAKQLGWSEIDARVVEPMEELQAKVVSLSENVQRRELSARDKAEACSFLLSRLGSAGAVAREVGVTEQTVRKWLGYAAVPESLKQMVEKGRLTPPQVTRIAESIPDEARALAVAERLAELRPPKDQRDRILDAVEEFSDRPVDVIFRKAEEARERLVITFVLPERWESAIARAANELGKDANDVARDATIEWLHGRLY